MDQRFDEPFLPRIKISEEKIEDGIKPEEKLAELVQALGKSSFSLKGHTSAVTFAAISPFQDIIISTSEDKCLKFWKFGSTSEEKSFALQFPILNASVNKNFDILVMLLGNNSISVWDIVARTESQSFTLDDSKITDVKVFPIQQQVLVVSEKIRIWDISQRKIHYEFSDISEKALCSFVSEKFIAFGLTSNKIVLWDIYQGKIHSSYVNESSQIFAVTIDIQNNYILGGGLKEIFVFDINLQSFSFSILAHTYQITSIAVSFNSKYILTGAKDVAVKLWDFSSKELLLNNSLHNSSISLVNFSPNGDYLLSACRDKLINMTYLNDLHEEKVLAGHNESVLSVVMCPDGVHLISGSEDSTLKVWSIETFSEVFTLTGHKNWVNCIVVKEDNSIVFSGSRDNTIKVWNFSEKTLITTLQGHEMSVGSICLCENLNVLVSASKDYTVKVWDLNNYLEKFTLRGHTAWINSVCVSKNNEFIFSAANDRLIKAWSIPNQNFEFDLEGHEHYVTCVIVTEDNQFLISASEDKTIKIWNFSLKVLETSLVGHKGKITCLMFINNEILVSAGKDGGLKFWNMIDKTEDFSVITHNSGVSSMCVSVDKQYLITASEDYTLKVWNFKEKIEKNKRNAHTNWITCLYTTSDNKYLITASWDTLIKIWNLQSNSEEFVLEGHKNMITDLCMNRCEDLIISCSFDKTIRVWDFHGKKEIFCLTHTTALKSVDISPDHKFLISSTYDFNIKLWDFASKSEIFTFTGHTDVINKVIITGNSCAAVSCSDDKTIRVWDLFTHSEIFKFTGHTGKINSICMNKSRNILVTASEDSKIRIFDLCENCEIFAFDNLKSGVSSVDFSTDEETIVCSTDDLRVIGLNLKERRKQFEFRVNNYKLISVKFSADGKKVFGGGSEELWEWSIGKKNTKFGKILKDLTRHEYQFRGSKANDIIFDIRDEKNQDFFRFHTTLTAIKAGKYELLKARNSEIVFGEYGFTFSHVLAFLCKSDALKSIISSDFVLKCDYFGHSPIYYSFLKNDHNFIDIVIEYLISIRNSENFSLIIQNFHAIRNDLSLILQSSSPKLPLFLNSLVYLPNSKSYFSSPNSTLPIFLYKSIQIPTINDFIWKSAGIKEELPLYLKSTLIPIDGEQFSNGSIELLRAILSCGNREIFRTEFLQSIISEKWQAIKFWSVFQAILMWTNLFLIVLLLVYGCNNIFILTPMVLVNILLILWEILQLKSTGLAYFGEIWNCVDVLRFIFTFCWIALEIIGYSEFSLRFFTVFLNLLRGLTGFRAFNGTRYYIKLIFRSVSDIKNFFLIFIYSTISFGILNIINSNLDFSFSNIWIVSYNLNLVNYDDIQDLNEFSLSYIVFLIFTIFNVILMLNLLISILGDSFDKFQVDRTIINFREMTEIILEIEEIGFWKRKDCEKKYLQVCDSGAGGEIEENWEGKIVFLEKMIGKIVEKNEEFQKIIEKEIKIGLGAIGENFKNNERTATLGLKEKIKEIEGKITGLEKKIEVSSGSIETKLDKLIESLRKE